MVSVQRLKKVSKFLSYHLRHRPDILGLELKPGGWVEVNTLLIAAANNNFPLSLTELQQVVAENDKQRFAFDREQKLIRANQGHSVKIDLQLSPVKPPNILYHGTYTQALTAIFNEGLCKMNRHHVHLSADVATAIKVGQRRGKPVVLKIDARRMTEAGFLFYLSDNQVWLVDIVPPEFITLNPD